ncbi:MFS transporter [Tengunoibacter tsumagoiensis]|uniref:MFS transporter n=1 Tax=Tengunoibacter tsumagoiensis TaxID=2014871 RepID=A0A401ZZZ0_9CHLR|nr:MFS transporter [Tengunoibacter tsumagoiensis]GCE12424.1 MFS transporter [Tengunoibacter tsumagoiensis]
MDHQPYSRKKRGFKFPALWQNVPFLLLWSGQMISTLGTGLSELALPILILLLTGSPALAGLLFAVRQLPYLLFSLPAGVLVDQWDRKKTMVCCDLFRWFALGSIPLTFAIHHMTLVQLYLVAFVEGTAYVLFSLAQISALPQVVKPAQLAQAYALETTTEYTATLLGPTLSAFLMGLASTIQAGAILAYLIDSITYLISACSLAAIQIPLQVARPTNDEPRRLMSEILTGFRFLWEQRELRAMALLTTVINFLTSAVSLVFIVLAQNQLHLTLQWIGVLLSVGGLGGIFGSILAPWLHTHLRCGQILLYSTIIWIGAFLLVALSPWFSLLLIGRFLISFTYPLYAVAIVSHRLLLTPVNRQGRVNSAFRSLSYGSEPLGAALGGLLVGILGPRDVFWLITLGFFGCLIMLWRTGLQKIS